jgi:ketosteroid isomerase-like protein
MRIAIAICLLGVVIAAAGCNQGPANAKAEPAKAENQKPAVNKAEEEAALRAADTAWSEAAGKKDAAAVAAFMTDDGMQLPPNAPVAKGPEALKKEWTTLLGMKDIELKWTPTIVQVADSGELGYTSGTYTLAFTDPKAGKVSDEGKYVEVWKKIDGKWKCYLDMYSSDNPAK